jgi:hypothetical protein
LADEVSDSGGGKGGEHGPLLCEHNEK